MDLTPVPFRSPVSAYERQAENLLAELRAGDPAALDLFRRTHPRFRDKVKWRPKLIPDSAIQDAALSRDDARLAVARSYDFVDWRSLADYVDAVAQEGPFFEFESAVEAVVSGDLAALEDALGHNPDLVRARSNRICLLHPPVMHRATLLHYVAANGVEEYRQKTPPNAVAIARALLQAGAEVDALADMYGVECTTMTMLVSSSQPAEAGLQTPLVEVLLDFGADIEGRGTRKWGGPLFTALAFGMSDAAKVLARRGARIDLPAAAGLGLTDEAVRLLASANASARHRALALAAQHGHADIVRLLLDAGEDPNRYNPEGMHAHSTPLHQAVLGGHEAVVRLLVERGARLDIRDTIWQGTPLGWALHGGGKAQARMTECLRSLGAE